MKLRNILPVLLAITALTSCSVYRSGQTPDDVYYSPGRTQDSYVTVENTRRGRSYDRYENTSPEDNYLRMKARDPYRWSTFDSYSSYMNDWQYNSGYSGYYSPYSYSGIYGGYSPYG